MKMSEEYTRWMIEGKFQKIRGLKNWYKIPINEENKDPKDVTMKQKSKHL